MPFIFSPLVQFIPAAPKAQQDAKNLRATLLCDGKHTNYARTRQCSGPSRRRNADTRFESCRQLDSRNTIASSHARESRGSPR